MDEKYKEEIEKILKEYFAEISRNLVEALVRAEEKERENLK